MTSDPVSADTHADKTAWPRVCRLVLLACLSLPVASALSQAPAASARPFVMVMDGEPTSYAIRWGTLIYTEAFRRLGIPLKLENYALARRAAMVEEGTFDGEAARVYGYADNHPNLVRVEESLVDFSFWLFGANPALRLERLEDLRSSDWLVEYRRGILICESTLKQLLPAERISDVLTQQQGLKKLIAGRTDLYCDIDVYVLQELQSPEFKGTTKVSKVISIGKTLPTYPYLHKKHAELAPRLAAVLKKMKTEGLIEAYRLRVERDLEWKP